MKPIHKPCIFTMKDVYVSYAEELLKNSEYTSRYDRIRKVRHGFIFKKVGSRLELVISWTIWKTIVESYFFRAKEKIIQGKELAIGSRIGRIRGARIQRNMENKEVDRGATRRLNKKDENGNPIIVYHTSEDYCRVEWVKTGELKNQRLYGFTTAATNTKSGKGFKKEFSDALLADPFLKFRYAYYPYVKKVKQCNTNTQVSET